MKFRAAALSFVALAAVVAGGVWTFREPAVSVDLATIDRGDVTLTVTEDGVAEVRDVYTIYAPTPGRVLRAPRHVGDRVVRGETVVAVIEPQSPGFLDARQRREAEAALRAAKSAAALAEAELESAEAEVTFWRAELERDVTLSERRTIAATTLERTRLELAIREAAARRAAAALAVRREEEERAAAALTPPDANGDARGDCCLTIRSPISGRVLEVMAESEHVVSRGEALLSVGDPEKMEIVVDLLSSDAVKVVVGASAAITRWGGDATLEARVRRVDPVAREKVSALGVEEQRTDVHLDIISDAALWRGLGHGFRTVAEIELARETDVVRAPIAALFRTGNEWSVFVDAGGRAELRRVEITLQGRRHAVVSAGLSPGEEVVLHPSDRIADGSRLERREPGPGS